MLKIGLTGNIAAGKSTVAKIFETLGVPVYYADDAAKRLMNENEELRVKLIEHFGPEIFQENSLNRSLLAAKAFADSEKTALLNALVHPHTIHDAAQWFSAQNGAYAIKEAALIFEAKIETSLDLVIGVSAPPELRIDRAMKRGNLTRDAVLARMSKQMPEDEKMGRCDFVIVNDEADFLIPQVIGIHEAVMLRIARLHS